MSSIPQAREHSILTKVLSANPPTVSTLSKQEGTFEASLCNWREQLRLEGRAVPGSDSTGLLVQRSVLAQSCATQLLVLHADNGAPIKSYRLKARLEALGIVPSHSRPRVSNDNPFSEALFRTLKYWPQWPRKGFSSLDQARQWVKRRQAHPERWSGATRNWNWISIAHLNPDRDLSPQWPQNRLAA